MLANALPLHHSFWSHQFLSFLIDLHFFYMYRWNRLIAYLVCQIFLCDYSKNAFKQYAQEKVFIIHGNCTRDCVSVNWGMKRFILVWNNTTAMPVYNPFIKFWTIHYTILCIASSHINSVTSSYCNAVMLQTTAIKYCIDLNEVFIPSQLLWSECDGFFLCLRAA